MAHTPAEIFDEIAGDLTSTTSAQKTKMFGMPSLKSDGKAFAGFFRDAMIFKLGELARSEALALSGAKHFDPMGGRPMKEWVEVPPEHEARWAGFARLALEYVSH